MKLFSTRSPEKQIELHQAVFKSLPADKGLYMPAKIKKMDADFFKHIGEKSFQEIGYEVGRNWIGESVEPAAMRRIIDESLNFPAPLKEIEERVYVLELFHGPTMAFKDFGARFMSRLMNYFLEKESREIHILVATSGDTGGAVAQGFYGVEGIQVTILYPKGKVSSLQEKQLTTLGKNVQALEIEGTFDDCQRLVKQAFLDLDLNKSLNLSSANSINIARLIPQSFYYFEAYAQVRRTGVEGPLVFSVPSGNFGNLTAGVFAKKMGLPVDRFVAATNVNDIVPEYLKTGIYKGRPSIATLSNAMDIGDPSNFERLKYIYKEDVKRMRKEISGYSFTDEETLEIIRTVENNCHYMLCPHTAIAYQGVKNELSTRKEGVGVFLSSAHPCKFPAVYTPEQWKKIEIPPQAEAVMNKEKKAVLLRNDFEQFKAWLLK